MNRDLISRDELAQWLTQELQKVEDCEHCSVSGILLLQKPDDQGCNWSDSITVRSAGVPAEYFGDYLRPIIARARARFNVVE